MRSLTALTRDVLQTENYFVAYTQNIRVKTTIVLVLIINNNVACTIKIKKTNNTKQY